MLLVARGDDALTVMIPARVHVFLHEHGLHGAVLARVPGKAPAEPRLGVAVAAAGALVVLRGALAGLDDGARGVADLLDDAAHRRRARGQNPLSGRT